VNLAQKILRVWGNDRPQAELARAAGISSSRLSKILQGGNTSFEIGVRIAQALGVSAEWLGDNPAAQCRLPSPERLEPRYVPRSSIRILIGRLRRSRRPWLADAVRFAVHTGARLGTIRAYTYDEIPPQRASMAPIRSLKTRRICYVPINRPLARWFDSVRETGSHAQTVFPHHHSRSWQLWLGRVALDLPGFAEGTGTGRLWHALRSTFAVRMAARNPLTGRPATMWELMAMLGHQDPQTTLGYVNVARAAGLL
jgi:integrase